MKNKDASPREKNREKGEAVMGIVVSYETAAKAKEAVRAREGFQFKCAQKTNLSESYISKILNGKASVEPEHLAKLCEMLNLDPLDFCQSCPLFNVHKPGAA